MSELWLIILIMAAIFLFSIVANFRSRKPPASPKMTPEDRQRQRELIERVLIDPIKKKRGPQPILVHEPQKRKQDIGDIELNSDFQCAMDLIEHQGQSAFITGKAGTGKSTLLNYFQTKTTKTTVVLAPTGLAALNVHGQTIHSFFKFPPKFIDKENIRKSRNVDLFQKLDTIIIDEVSMVRADLMDGIDVALRLNRGNPVTPFGGVQLVFFGDLFQLPPIVKGRDLKEYFSNYYGGPYFFLAKAFEGLSLPCIDLQKIYRQSDEKFKDLLNNIREKKIDDDLLTTLNSRVHKGSDFTDFKSYITLTTTNEAALQKNMALLEKMNTKQYAYKASVDGRFDPTSFPTDDNLYLKKGAQVMMIKNDLDKRWVNGTLGQISELEEETIWVEIDGNVYEVEKETWQNIEYHYNRESNRIEQQIIGTFQQYPLRLAWAITIHKSQGQTFDRVAIDLGRGSFAHGQTYVALSRCRSLESIALSRPINLADIIFDNKVYEFNKVFRRVLTNDTAR